MRGEREHKRAVTLCRTVLLVVSAVLTPHTSHLTPDGEAAQVEESDGLRVAYLSGTPYDVGRQHGELLREEVRTSVSRVLGYFRQYLKIPWVRSGLVNWWLDYAWRAAQPFVASDLLEELRGLADGSGVPLRELYRLHALPERTYSCANLAAWGRVTAGGRLIHVRNLDWNIDVGIQDAAIVFVMRPAGKRALVNVGWAGFIGVLTGINDAQLSIGQIGAETVDTTFRGEPMAFLMRRILEETGTLDEAVALILQAKRTVGVNYVVAEARTPRGVVVETTRHHARVFEANDASEHTVSYARPVVDAVFRADTAMDPAIRDRQQASGGDPRRPGLEDPVGSSAYDVRYLGQAAGLLASMGHLTASSAQAIARAVAPSSNVQSVVFAWPEAWIANADGTTPAARTGYRRLNLEQLFAQQP